MGGDCDGYGEFLTALTAKQAEEAQSIQSLSVRVSAARVMYREQDKLQKKVNRHS